MIRLEFTDKCKGCYYAKLELIECGMETMHSGKTLWSVRCIHEDACKRMEKYKGDGDKDD